jgi:hypothetical protein
MCIFCFTHVCTFFMEKGIELSFGIFVTMYVGTNFPTVQGVVLSIITVLCSVYALVFPGTETQNLEVCILLFTC